MICEIDVAKGTAVILYKIYVLGIDLTMATDIANRQRGPNRKKSKGDILLRFQFLSKRIYCTRNYSCCSSSPVC